jgi:hypothetical protein
VAADSLQMIPDSEKRLAKAVAELEDLVVRFETCSFLSLPFLTIRETVLIPSSFLDPHRPAQRMISPLLPNSLLQEPPSSAPTLSKPRLCCFPLLPFVHTHPLSQRSCRSLSSSGSYCLTGDGRKSSASTRRVCSVSWMSSNG